MGWRPVEHSIEELDDWAARLAPVFPADDKGNITQERNLTAEEQRFIANERAMCVASCYYFLTRYYWIKAKNKILRFTFRQGQWILWQMLCWLDERGFSKQLQILKARQLGVSTLAEGIMLWLAMFVPGSVEQIGSADGQKTQTMLGMLLFAKDRISDLYPWLPPDETRSKRASDRPMIGFEKIGTSVIVQHGAMRGGMGQGSTPTGVHLSECSQYSNPVKQIDEGLLKSLHASVELVVLLESTGDASHRSAWWWKRKWEWNRDHYWKGEARMLPVFLPWHTTPELYPGEWINEHPVPHDFQPHAETQAHVQRCEAYVRCTPMLAKILGAEWKMPIEQQWFWQFNYDEAVGQRVEKSWIRQMPGDDYEALLGEREKVVGEGTIEVMRCSQSEVSKIPVYMLIGDGVPEKYEPPTDDVWYGDDSPPRLKCSWKNNVGETFNWMFVPMKPVPEEKFDPLGKFLIFEEPKPGFDYSVALDTGTGVGGDRSALGATRVGTDADPDVEVAEYASDDVSLDDIYIFGCALTALYSKHLVDHRHPKIIIEQRRKYGDRPYSLMRFGMGFTRWHLWGQGFDRKTREDKHIGKNARVGWFTNEWSRPMLLGAFFGAVENKWYVVRSKWLAEEMEGMEQRITESGKTRVDHESGEHDDRVFRAAMGYFTMHRHDVMASRMKKRYDEPEGGDIIIEHGPSVQTITIPRMKGWSASQHLLQ
ncbi:MAG: hypothetical protein WB870_11610 [Gallionellaceae bacterium]